MSAPINHLQEFPMPSLKLHEFMRQEHDAILNEWGRQNRDAVESARHLSEQDLRNNLPKLLEAIAERSEQAEWWPSLAHLADDGPVIHAEQRWRLGFSLEEMTREYGLLRAVILRKLAPLIDEISAEELVFLNQTLDLAITEGVNNFVSRANRVLKDEQERLQVTLESIGDGVISTDADRKISYVNPAAEAIIGYAAKDMMGQPVDTVLVALDEETKHPLKSLAQVATESGALAAHDTEINLRRADGSSVPAEEVASPLRDSNGDFMGVVITFRDVSKVRALTMQLSYQASHDVLTDLPNRSLLIDRLELELAHAERNNYRLAVLYLDLDLFKDVNDMLGHAAGDQLLIKVARRLQKSVRKTDTVCRVGGDEFIILLSEFDDLDFVSDLCSKIIRRVKSPYRIGSEAVDISTSVGVSVFPEDGQDPHVLMKNADIAMCQAKSLGRNGVQFYTPEMNQQASERRKLQTDLRAALSAEQLFLHFQPQVSLLTGKPIGAEALLRWRHPRLGMIAPARFIPVAEHNREIMIAIGHWALEEACRQARSWLDAGHPPMRISVNISVVQLRQDTLVSHITRALERYQLPADLLQLELTESVIMSDVNGAAERVRALEEIGVRISIDDFGTGYSSLSYLKDLPVDELKIDKSFVSDVNTSLDKAAIVQAVIQLGQSLNLRVVAEGVEDQRTVDFLTAHGCESAQGFYFNKAMAADAFERQYFA